MDPIFSLSSQNCMDCPDYALGAGNCLKFCRFKAGMLIPQTHSIFHSVSQTLIMLTCSS